MHICNKAGWVPEFAVAISTLEAKTGLKKDAINRARQRLQQAGRISFRSRSGQQSALYSIVFFESNCDVLKDANRITNRAQTASQTAPQTASIIKLNETNNNNKNARARDESINIFDLIEKEYGRALSPIESDLIISWEKNHSPEIIREAIKRSVLRGVFNLNYSDKILLEWEKANIKTIQGIDDYESKKQKRGKAPSSSVRKIESPKKDMSFLYEL
ncbi:DnaD domain-containing protein [Dehalobacterium formicoaceticum]|uniref:DnaD domain-containing protein n=1 Tax=Dehalobacterium formicoaceticum TaxID=51515 RepID=UPI000B7ED499|nr:DnaD domain protein [Dehalobacterium formicoaceticum]